MGLITRTYSVSASDEIIAAHWDDLDTIYTEFNGNIDNANIKAAAAIAASKLDLTDITVARFNNNAQLQFENAAGSAEAKMYMDTSDGFTIIGDDTTADYSMINVKGSGATRGGYIKIFSAGQDKRINIYHSDTDGIFQTDSGDIILNPDTNVVRCATDKGQDMGEAALAWDDVYADDFQNVADISFLDSVDDVGLIKKIKKGKGKDPKTGNSIVDDDTLPKVILAKSRGKRKNHPKKGAILKDPNGKPYYSMRATVGLLFGAIKQLDARLEKLEK